MRGTIHRGHRFGREDLPLAQPGTQAGERGLSRPHRTEGEVIRRHVVHPLLQGLPRQIRHSGIPPDSMSPKSGPPVNREETGKGEEKPEALSFIHSFVSTIHGVRLLS